VGYFFSFTEKKIKKKSNLFKFLFYFLVNDFNFFLSQNSQNIPGRIDEDEVDLPMIRGPFSATMESFRTVPSAPSEFFLDHVDGIELPEVIQESTVPDSVDEIVINMTIHE
jgi:hypothetical protein